MTVPLLDLKIQYAALKEEILAAMDEVLASQHFILGPQVAALEAEVSSYVGARHAVGCASGSDAILLALMALGIGPGDEVICPAYTFFSTAGTIARLGARPIFVDLDPTTYNMDPVLARQAAESCSRLRAFMPVHLYGQAADMDAYLGLSAQFGVPLIEDAAQAIGTRDATGAPVGVRGTIGCFSFFPTKNLGGFGDGGLVTTGDEELAELMRILRVHGGKPKYHHQIIGLNSRLDALQAAVLRVKLAHLDAWHEARRANADHYDRLFHEAGAQTSAAPLAAGGLPIRTPLRLDPPSTHIYNQYVVRVPASIRDDLRRHLTESGIGTEIYYPIPLHLQSCFSYLGGRPGDLPESEAAALETIALPIFPELTVEQLDHVAKTVIAYVGRHATVGVGGAG
jgi:dTDP-4-amino-4,6-dideoxygalactose transaminase